MTARNDPFEKAVILILAYEGAYGNDSRDKGGETKYGISKARFPHVDIKNLSINGAKALYHEHFWSAFSCGNLPWPLAFAMFDCYVQFNPINPIKWLQTAVGATADGKLGPQTFKAANATSDPIEAALRVMCQRAEYRLKHPEYDYFGKGWRKRDLTVMADAVRFDKAPHA